MLTLILIGLVGGLITGVSPCILPVLPVVFFASGVTRSAAPKLRSPVGGPGFAPRLISEPKVDDPPPARRVNWRPYQVIGGLVLSFTVFTLLGSLLISALGLPDGILRYAGLAVLVAVGLGLIFPRLDALLERPFSWIPARQFGRDRGGFALGLGLGLLYVPCAGPVLAAITVAGATGHIGPRTIALTASFAVGAALPLLLFALAGARAAERIKAFKTRARAVRTIAGLVMILLAVALVFNLPAIVQRALPDYTGGLQTTIGNSQALRNTQLTPNIDASNAQLVNCPSGSPVLHECGPAPALKPTGWLNSAPIDLAALRGDVTIVDFWTYSCINCQRDVPHVEAWYQAYQKAGLHVIGVHSPEFVFERDPDNIKAGAKSLGVTYPIAIDNKLSTWTAYRNQYWPALYLIDATGTVRSIHFGEGDYPQTETLIRQLLTAAHPAVTLPAPTDRPPTALTPDRTPETYLGYPRLVGHTAGDPLVHATATTYALPADVPGDHIGLGGTWTVGDQSALAGPGAQLAFNVKAKDAHLVLGGTGTLTVTDGGATRNLTISGPPRLYDLTDLPRATRSTLHLTFTSGLQAYSFTFG